MPRELQGYLVYKETYTKETERICPLRLLI